MNDSLFRNLSVEGTVAHIGISIDTAVATLSPTEKTAHERYASLLDNKVQLLTAGLESTDHLTDNESELLKFSLTALANKAGISESLEVGVREYAASLGRAAIKTILTFLYRIYKWLEEKFAAFTDSLTAVRHSLTRFKRKVHLLDKDDTITYQAYDYKTPLFSNTHDIFSNHIVIVANMVHYYDARSGTIETELDPNARLKTFTLDKEGIYEVLRYYDNLVENQSKDLIEAKRDVIKNKNLTEGDLESPTGQKALKTFHRHAVLLIEFRTMILKAVLANMKKHVAAIDNAINEKLKGKNP